MFHCKIAHTEAEFKQIAHLNYQTFVEEIPQHTPNARQTLEDKFHTQNTYIVLYCDQEMIGMLAVRDQRPFSLDGKIGEIEQYLAADLCQNLCEVRLLAIKPQFRQQNATFLRLIQALYAYLLDRNYSACVISGTTRQLKLYRKMGFIPFAPAVGTEQARYLPMVLSAEHAQIFYDRFKTPSHHFYPGPVAQTSPLTHTEISHRSTLFKHLWQQVRRQLLQMSEAENVAMLFGSGTLANEVMLQQLKARHGTQAGVVCCNGEFGQRLAQQARALGMNFSVYQQDWGRPFDAEELTAACANSAWVLAAHGETSTGYLNDLSLLTRLKQQLGFTLALDCVSSFGAVPFSLADVDLASATSGKAIGALAGLSWVFYQQAAQTLPEHGSYCQLSQYENTTPYTLPTYLLANTAQALNQYPERYRLLTERLYALLHHPILHQWLLPTEHYPTAISYQFPPVIRDNAHLNSLFLHQNSQYLQARHWSQLSTIQPSFAEDFAALTDWLQVMHTWMDLPTILMQE